MRARPLDFVLLALGVVTALLLATDVWPGARGPENWRWARRVLESPGALFGVIVVFGAQFLVASRIRMVWGGGSNAKRLPLMAAACGLTFAQMVLLTAVEPGGLSNVSRRVRDTSFTSYHTIAHDVDDPVDFLRRYHRLQDSFPVHGPSQPPGRVLYFWLVDRIVGEEAGPAWAGFLLMGMGALCLLPMVLLAGGRSAPGAVGNAVLLMGCLPSFLLFTPQTDHLLLLAGLTAAALLLEAMRYASRPWAPALAFGAGLSASIGIFASFTELAALAAWGVAFAGTLVLARIRHDPFPTRRQIIGLAGAGLAGLAAVPIVTTALGMNWPEVFRACLEGAHRVQVLIHGRVYSTWVVWNLWDFVLFLGPPLAVAWLVQVRAEVRAGVFDRGFVGRAPLEIPFAAALLVALVLLDLSGRILGETGRIWMFLMPFAVGAAAVAYGRRPVSAIAPLAIGQLLVLLSLRAFLNVPG